MTGGFTSDAKSSKSSITEIFRINKERKRRSDVKANVWIEGEEKGVTKKIKNGNQIIIRFDSKRMPQGEGDK